MTVLQYPLDMNTVSVDYVVFRPMKYRTNNSPNPGGPISSAVSGGGQGPAAGSPTGPPVVLYMPLSTPSVSNNNGWKQESFQGPLGAIQRDIGTSAARGIAEITQGNVGATDAVPSVHNMINKFTKRYANMEMGGGAAGQFGLDALSKAMSKGSPNTFMALAKGQIYNPNIEMIYQGPQIRQFTMDYNFVPKSEQEAQTANQIIKYMKERSSANPVGGMFEVPDIWEVTYMSGTRRNENMNQFKRCALTDVQVQDNTELEIHMAYDQGVPVTTAMRLTFMEVDIITRKDHESSFSNRGY